MSRRPASPDRRSISSGRVWLLTVLIGLSLYASLTSLPGATDRSDGPRSFAGEAAALCAVLAVFGLRSVPIRWVVRGMALASGLLLARFGELAAVEGLAGSWRVLLWIGSTAAALVLAPSTRSVIGQDAGIAVRAADVPAVQPAAPSTGSGTRAWSTPPSLVIGAVALVGAVALLLGPRASTAFPVGSSIGQTIDMGDARSDNALVATDRLDMTTRPRLTSQVVMTVRSSIASFWRTETYDQWDGSAWTRSDRTADLLADGSVVPSEEDVAALDGQSSTQEFRLEIGYATAAPSAASPVQVDSPQRLAQRRDGTLLAAEQPMGAGTSYTVTSRQLPADPETLQVAGELDVPDEVLEQYARRPIATQRVAELAASITADADTDIEKIEALEQWMDENTEYSLDAPLSPRGVDVVDDFLFESQLGWCEQIASSLVVMARLSGVPARLATGFTQGTFDAVANRFVVRERDAHAWAEVWFPEVGWVTFDPTASVPLAGTAEATPGAGARDWREVGGAMLVVVGLLTLAAGVIGRHWRRRRASRVAVKAHRAALRDRWDVAAEAEIEGRGAEAGRSRLPGETLPAYGQVLEQLLDDPEVSDLARRIEAYRYAPSGALASSASILRPSPRTPNAARYSRSVD
jgi:transglutaminase-like putative cysteine protease